SLWSRGGSIRTTSSESLTRLAASRFCFSMSRERRTHADASSSSDSSASSVLCNLAPTSALGQRAYATGYCSAVLNWLSLKRAWKLDHYLTTLKLLYCSNTWERGWQKLYDNLYLFGLAAK
ncbi:jg23205, partial [Pararge aegeria aegeria]